MYMHMYIQIIMYLARFFCKLILNSCSLGKLCIQRAKKRCADGVDPSFSYTYYPEAYYYYNYLISI